LANDNRICSGIIESTFSDFRTIVHDYSEDVFGFDIALLTDYLIDRAGEIADFNPDYITPYQDCFEINKPMLIVHGDADKKINISYGTKNFNNINSNRKEFLKIENAGHLDVWEKGGATYFEKVLKFLEK